MDHLQHSSRYVTGLLVAAMTLCLSSCLKNTDQPLTISEPGKPAVFGNLFEALSASKATLFEQAIKRVGLDSALKAGGAPYTVLAPSDAAMQAAGLTQSVIQSFQLDSLNKLVGYHILPGEWGDTVLNEAALNIKAATLWMMPPSPPVYTPNVPLRPAYPLPLFIKSYAGHGLYVNDELVSKEVPAKAANGYLYSTQKVILQPFVRSVYDFIKSQPDLSMYSAALKIVDEINYDNGNIDYSNPADTILFQKLGIFPGNRTTAFESVNCFTIFAPTNAAFAAAGFHTVDDIRNFAEIDYNTSITYQSPMDSVLRRHVVFDRYNSSTLKTILLYCDLQYNSKGVNAGGVNKYVRSMYEGWDGGNYMKLPPLVFSEAGGLPQIKWSNDPAKPLVPVPDNDPAASNPNHFMGYNGVVYKVNTLFFRN